MQRKAAHTTHVTIIVCWIIPTSPDVLVCFHLRNRRVHASWGSRHLTIRMQSPDVEHALRFAQRCKGRPGLFAQLGGRAPEYCPSVTIGRRSNSTALATGSSQKRTPTAKSPIAKRKGKCQGHLAIWYSFLDLSQFWCSICSLVHLLKLKPVLTYPCCILAQIKMVSDYKRHSGLEPFLGGFCIQHWYDELSPIRWSSERGQFRAGWWSSVGWSLSSSSPSIYRWSVARLRLTHPMSTTMQQSHIVLHPHHQFSNEFKRIKHI